MVLCLLSRDSHGDTGKLNHEETVQSPFLPKKVKFLGFLVKIRGAQDFFAKKKVRSSSVCIFHSPMAISVSPRYPSQYLYSIHTCACDL